MAPETPSPRPAEPPPERRDAPEESRGSHSARIEKLARQRADPGARYEVKGELGRGGMGLVLEVWDTDLRRALAMKVLRRDGGPRPGSSSASENVVRFLEEAQITAQLDHPGIVPVHELSVDSEGRVYFTMGRVRGQNLKELVQELHARAAAGGEWTLTRMVGVILKVCETMAFAHAKGVVHRDLKPTNVMIGRFGAVYVMDWGLAAVKGREESAHDIRLRSSPDVTLSEVSTDRSGADEDTVDAPLVTLDGAVIGTPAYMAPEQARGEIERVGPLSDVYSVGAMLYQILTGRAPYVAPGMRVSAHTLLALVINGPPEPVEALARVPGELQAICARAMARRPEERYPDMQAFAADLQAYLEGRVVRAYETGAWAELKKWTLRNRALALALALLLAGAFAGLALWIRTQALHAKELFLAADVYRYSYLVGQADTLWPLREESVPRMQAWVAEMEALAARRDQHVERLEQLARLAPDADVEARRETLQALVDGLAHQASADPAESVLTHVRERLAASQDLWRRSIEDPAEAWRAAREAIEQHPAYGGLVLTPQLGLVPLGQDPASGLWEFAHVLSGEVPRRGAAGALELDAASAVVLVLIPGGSFDMGAERPSARIGQRFGPNLDPAAYPFEGPVHRVELAPYFLSKHELTQAQWRRMSHAVPSVYNPDSEMRDRLTAGAEWLHPVEQVSWEDCERTLARFGLLLPTEAQWERAARGGTSTIYASGDERESLRGKINIADESAVGSQWAEQQDWPDFDDGYPAHAPVNALPANPFGLHNVHDNVSEWCRDWFVQYGEDMSTLAPGDAYRLAASPEKQASFRIVRGGSFRWGILEARLSWRQWRLPSFADFFIGVRPARAIER
jgi:formylglycine-generating enzyme required for sulfatase activity/serine/threonine protein kinase